MYYQENRKRAQTKTTKPTLTDQSQADETNINKIIARYRITGRAPGKTQEPMYGDFVGFPKDLREMIETSRRIPGLQTTLPPQLRDMTVEQLLTLNDQEITRILTPEPPPKAEQEKT